MRTVDRSLTLVVGLVSIGTLGGLGLLGVARAQAEGPRVLDSWDSVRDACAAAEADPGRELYALAIEPDWTFGVLDDDGRLEIAPRRNFRALAGRVELVASRMEPIAVASSPEQADRLEVARERGARLILGFFLGFDEPERPTCIVRSRHAVTTLRADIAFVELRSRDGEVLAREDTERTRSWQDQRGSEEAPGGASWIGEPSSSNGSVPDIWNQQLRAAAQGALGRALGRCRELARQRGGRASGQVVVRARLDGRTGRALGATIALSDIRESETVECIRAAIQGLELSPVGEGRLELLLPVRLADRSER